MPTSLSTRSGYIPPSSKNSPLHSPVRLSEILIDAIFVGRKAGFLALRFWGDGGDVEKQLSAAMGEFVNARYRAQGMNGNYFFWQAINVALEEIYGCEDPERYERFVQLQAKVRGW